MNFDGMRFVWSDLDEAAKKEKAEEFRVLSDPEYGAYLEFLELRAATIEDLDDFAPFPDQEL